MKEKIYRLLFDIIILGSIALVFIIMPTSFISLEAKEGFLSIFIGKLAFVSAGIIHAHISRKMLFPYIDFAKERRWDNNVMIISWYIVIIFCWARGG